MKWILTPEELSVNTKLVDDFFLLYEDPANFPDPDERENPLYIRERISSSSSTPHTHLLIDYNEELGLVQGGAVVEFYPDSQCALLTYIFVHPLVRGKGVASNLIHGEHGLALGIRTFQQKYQKEVKAVFFESNNPSLTPIENDSMNPVDRLMFFHKAGAKILDIPYVQPSLDETKLPVSNLYFLTFPDFCGLKSEISYAVFARFYREFCHSLLAEEDFIEQKLDDYQVYLGEETKSIQLKDIAVTLSSSQTIG